MIGERTNVTGSRKFARLIREEKFEEAIEVARDQVEGGAAVIDIGINQIEDSDGKARIVGDVDTDAVKEVASWITPVPGGVGPVTVALLMRNALRARKRQIEEGWV